MLILTRHPGRLITIQPRATIHPATPVGRLFADPGVALDRPLPARPTSPIHGVVHAGYGLLSWGGHRYLRVREFAPAL